ncbi:MAG: hypothetical protein HYV63_23330 [Candidatus Schekmanbacteria bacterium]|nr:hypothetical protein [Candidatus Schekmanbacteria bacterium]
MNFYASTVRSTYLGLPPRVDVSHVLRQLDKRVSELRRDHVLFSVAAIPVIAVICIVFSPFLLRAAAVGELRSGVSSSGRTLSAIAIVAVLVGFVAIIGVIGRLCRRNLRKTVNCESALDPQRGAHNAVAIPLVLADFALEVALAIFDWPRRFRKREGEIAASLLLLLAGRSPWRQIVDRLTRHGYSSRQELTRLARRLAKYGLLAELTADGAAGFSISERGLALISRR